MHLPEFDAIEIEVVILFVLADVTVVVIFFVLVGALVVFIFFVLVEALVVVVVVSRRVGSDTIIWVESIAMNAT